MNDSSKKFFSALAAIVFLFIAYGFYHIFIQKEFAVFLEEDDIPEYSSYI